MKTNRRAQKEKAGHDQQDEAQDGADDVAVENRS